jgi:hypothetical protein
MKLRTILTIALLVVALLATLFLGLLWGNESFMSLGGLRDAGPYSREAEIAFIRSRVAHPLVRPEWIAGEGDDLEWKWSMNEMKARVGLPVITYIALICVVGVWLRKQCPTRRVQRTPR